jgi:hypothetical protein
MIPYIEDASTEDTLLSSELSDIGRVGATWTYCHECPRQENQSHDCNGFHGLPISHGCLGDLLINSAITLRYQTVKLYPS